MGLFSRKDKHSKGDAGFASPPSNASINSGASRGPVDRTSAGSLPSGGPRSPQSPVKLPRIELPRPPDPQLDPAGYLRSLSSVRERCNVVFRKALRNELHHFDVDLDKFSDVVTFVANLIKVRSCS